MSSKKILSLLVVAAMGLAVIGSIAIADAKKESDAAAASEIQLPPGWTQEDMQACIVASTPGEKHKLMASEAGVWHGKTTMWMGSEDVPPMTSECTSSITPMMDGRFIKCEIKGDMPGMGPFEGFGIYGFDNVSQKFVSSWIDNHGTGIMTGVGELSDDREVLTWKNEFNCPLTKKPVEMRQVETVTGPNTKRLEMFGENPKTGKEYKMMLIELTRKTDAPAGG